MILRQHPVQLSLVNDIVLLKYPETSLVFEFFGLQFVFRNQWDSMNLQMLIQPIDSIAARLPYGGLRIDSKFPLTLPNSSHSSL